MKFTQICSLHVNAENAMFRDELSLAGARRDPHALAKADLTTVLLYGLLAAVVLATGVHLILSALHAPVHLLPLPEPGSVSQGAGSPLLMAASIAALLVALAALGINGLVHVYGRFERISLTEPVSSVVKSEVATDLLEACTVPGFLVLFGVAHFSFLSSRYGADATNRIARLITDELARTFGASHRVAGRSAEGEFVVMVASRNYDDCILLVEQARRSVAMQSISSGGANLSVALLAAIAPVVPNTPLSVPLGAARRAMDHSRNCACESAVYAFEGHAKAC